MEISVLIKSSFYLWASLLLTPFWLFAFYPWGRTFDSSGSCTSLAMDSGTAVQISAPDSGAAGGSGSIHWLFMPTYSAWAFSSNYGRPTGRNWNFLCRPTDSFRAVLWFPCLVFHSSIHRFWTAGTTHLCLSPTSTKVSKKNIQRVAVRAVNF